MEVKLIGLNKEGEEYVLTQEHEVQRPDGEKERVVSKRYMSKRGIVNELNAMERVIKIKRKQLSPTGVKGMKRNIDEKVKEEKKKLSKERKNYKFLVEECGGKEILEEYRKELEEKRKNNKGE